MKSFPRAPSALLLALALVLAPTLSADKTPIPALERFTLDNGLELFVLENHSTPLVYMEIAFRTGAYAQTPETAGLFHLYEHMMFKGNAKYKSAAEVQKAYLDLGVTSWNGSTGAEKVNYYFTVPADKVREGLEFWSWAVREPTLDPGELEREIQVVSAEISGDLADPGHVVQAAVDRALFPSFPWRRDPLGNPEVVRSCTVEQLRAIKDSYYVPNNAALFVGGDIDPEAALAMVKEVYGSWERAADPWAKAPEPQAFPATEGPRLLVFPDPALSPAYGIVNLYLRGPDVDSEPEPTYAADVFGYLIDNPAGPFKQGVLSDHSLAIPDPNYLGGYYYTQRDGGMIHFYAYMMSKAVFPFAMRGKLFSQAILEEELPAIAGNPAYWPEEDYAQVKTIIEDAQILQMETVDGFLSNLSFWWASASTDYFFGYVPSMKDVGHAEIAAYLDGYAIGKAPIICVRVNPQVYESQAEAFADAGYETVGEENAFWWRKDGE